MLAALGDQLRERLAAAKRELSAAIASADAAGREGSRLARAVSHVQAAEDLERRIRVVTNGGEPVPAPMSLRDVLQVAGELALPRGSERVRLVLPSHLPEVLGDLVLTRHVLAHLVTRAAAAGGGVEISTAECRATDPATRLARHAVVVTVQSVARGGQPVVSRAGPSEDLSLLLATAIADRQRAHLTAFRGPDGTHRFELHLPVAPAGVRTEAAGAADARRALVVEPDPSLALRLRQMMGYLGWMADFASDAREALSLYEHAHLAERPYRLVMLDPHSTREPRELKGFAQILRHDRDARLVVCTGPDGDDEKLLAGASVDAWLPRPFRFADVHQLTTRLGDLKRG
ncbi:MAG: hypothetical protein H6744_06635 [Deltaproteobacteria bacterium]|nr:hypothetical protein [Deltaproteobacteria bacterium]MCB9786357.1 hypothetical protein [Deltaproteobacteria bacterium]